MLQITSGFVLVKKILGVRCTLMSKKKNTTKVAKKASITISK